MRKFLGYSILLLLFSALFGTLARQWSFPVALFSFGMATIFAGTVYGALILIIIE